MSRWVITNRKDEANLKRPEYRAKLIERLARAIVAYLVEYGRRDDANVMDEQDDMAPDDDALDLTDAVSGKRRRSFLMRFVGLVSVLFSLLFLGLVGVAAGVLWVFWTYGKDLPDYHQLASYEPPVATRIHAGNGALIAEHARERRVFMPVEAMPPRLIQAFLSAEDKAFYSHFGVDPRALFGLW